MNVWNRLSNNSILSGCQSFVPVECELDFYIGNVGTKRCFLLNINVPSDNTSPLNSNHIRIFYDAFLLYVYSFFNSIAD